MKNISQFLIIVWLFIAASQICFADEATAVYPMAIFDFVEKGNELSGLGEKVSAVVFSQLVLDPNISLVERDELNKLADEAVLNLSGMVNTQQANQIGQLTGARIIVTGTIFEIEDKLMIVSKIIGTETSRVLGASVKGEINDSVVTLAETLSAKIAETVAINADSLVAKPKRRVDYIAELKQKLSKVKKPSLSINIQERHINQNTTDPAAETEMILYSTESGFEVIDYSSGKARKADVLITGEGFTEFATRKGDIVGVRARLEVKAIDQATKKIIAVDRQTELEVDLSEIIAAKKALERASAKIAMRILPKITAQDN